MASILRQIVAGPRARHPEANLDLCYVTDNIIATSGPSSTYPQRAYRNPTDELVKFLDYKHGDKWAIWEFRAEGTGYTDEEVYNRIRHYPWPDHHPPPFALIPNIMASMRDWLNGPDAEKGRVVVVHCKAGKGRSGTIATSYMISEDGWTREDALERFTARRMRPGFGPGVSIPSQVRWVGYVDWWTKHGKIYVERQIEVLEVHVWGLRSGVKVAVEGYVEEGRRIKVFHTFSKRERTILVGSSESLSSDSDLPTTISKPVPEQAKMTSDLSEKSSSSVRPDAQSLPSSDAPAAAALFRPSKSLISPTSDINVDFERRNRAKYGLTMVTSVAHVWFNAYFESFTQTQSKNADAAAAVPSDPAKPADSGVFTLEWDAMDGIKGSSRKGTRAFDSMSVVWRAVSPSTSPDAKTEDLKPARVITEPLPGEPIPDSGPSHSDRFSHLKPHDAPPDHPKPKNIGLRSPSPASADLSRASSPPPEGSSTEGTQPVADDDSEMGIKSHDINGEEYISKAAESLEQGLGENNAPKTQQ